MACYISENPRYFTGGGSMEVLFFIVGDESAAKQL